MRRPNLGHAVLFCRLFGCSKHGVGRGLAAQPPSEVCSVPSCPRPGLCGNPTAFALAFSQVVARLHGARALTPHDTTTQSSNVAATLPAGERRQQLQVLVDVLPLVADPAAEQDVDPDLVAAQAIEDAH